MFRAAGCTRLYLKEMAWNHDAKRQVYLTSSLSVFNMLPSRIDEAPPMPPSIVPTRKPKPRGGDRIFGHLKFYWIDHTGRRERAASAKIIYYPQYPEIRLSGFLRGIRLVPSRYLREKSGETYSNRLLFMGTTSVGEVIAFIAVDHDLLRNEVRDESGYDAEASINEIRLVAPDRSNRDELLAALYMIHQKGWIDGKRLSAGELTPCKAPQAVGYTLEAELGVSPNGENAPDFMGFEVKAHTVSKLATPSSKVVTVLTPEPDLGVYKTAGVIEFLRRWGYSDKKGRPDRQNFGGIYRVNNRHLETGLMMVLKGFDIDAPDVIASDGFAALVDSNGEIAAGWSFCKLIDCWGKKHAASVYVPALKRVNGRAAFHYGAKVGMGEGADFSLVLGSMARGELYLDPAVKAEQWSTDHPAVHKRNQLRIKMSHVPNLYRRWEWATAAAQP